MLYIIIAGMYSARVDKKIAAITREVDNLATTYVLDSNVLLSDPEAIHAFPGAGVVIPGVVIEEIDAKKYGLDGTAYNARQVARQLDLLRSGRSLKEPVPLDNGSTLRVELNHRSLDCLRDHFPEVNNDNRLLAVALNLHREAQARDPHGRVVLVSQDAIVRIKADALGLNAEDYLAPENRITAGIYTGYEEVEVDPGLVDRFYLSRQLPLAEIPRQLQPHQYVILKSYGSSQSAIGRCDSEGQVLLPLNLSGNNIWGISPRNVQQKMALDLLLDSSIPLVTITGRAGTGKTLLALAAGLHLTQEEAAYQKLLIARPVVPLGRDIGYLPGTKEEKLRPWMQPIYDNLEFLFSQRKGTLDEILSGLKNVQVEALTYIRGRTLPGQYIIIDEAQNLTRHEVKTVISRVGEGSKIVLLGDPEQIDHPYLDAGSNGLAYAVAKFQDQSLAGHITLVKGERSPLARLAAAIL
jgi:PhoH-like ATPase